MKQLYLFEYKDENDLRKKERNVKKYNMLAYKKWYFEYYPKLKEGEFIGEIVDINKKENYKTYEMKLPTDAMFSKVHGDIVVHYTVYETKKTIMLTNITPEEVLEGNHTTELPSYKGVVITKENASKDIFKINLLNMINKD